MKKFIILRTQAERELLALLLAQSRGYEPVVLPKAANAKEFQLLSDAIYGSFSFFCPELKRIAFEEGDAYYKKALDPFLMLKAGKLDPHVWEDMAKSSLAPFDLSRAPQYPKLIGRKNVLFAPLNLGMSDKPLSFAAEFFFFLKNLPEDMQLVLIEHFDKNNSSAAIKELFGSFKLYIPGTDCNRDVFGMRRINCRRTYGLYSEAKIAVGAAGGHTWYMLSAFKERPQIIFYNRDWAGFWGNISKAYRRAGYPIYAIGYGEKSDFKQLSVLAKEKFESLAY